MNRVKQLSYVVVRCLLKEAAILGQCRSDFAENFGKTFWSHSNPEKISEKATAFFVFFFFLVKNRVCELFISTKYRRIDRPHLQNRSFGRDRGGRRAPVQPTNINIDERYNIWHLGINKSLPKKVYYQSSLRSSRVLRDWRHETCLIKVFDTLRTPWLTFEEKQCRSTQRASHHESCLRKTRFLFLIWLIFLNTRRVFYFSFPIFAEFV